MKMYEVGGCVRDEILGLPSKDIDFSVVFDDGDLYQMADIPTRLRPTPFEWMVQELKRMGFEIFLETPEHLTARARFPRGDVSALPAGLVLYSLMTVTADFVLARKESAYSDGRRPDKVEPGTLLDDLARRDFTMNAIAKEPGSPVGNGYYDPFNGIDDISHRLIRCVGDPVERITEDALRAVRALRFAVTKGFKIEGELQKVLLFNENVFDLIETKIADDRIKDELSKMFRFSTTKSLDILYQYPALTEAMFNGRVRLDATLKTKNRGK